MISNGKGDIKSRFGLFKTAFRVKLNNWCYTNGSKHVHFGKGGNDDQLTIETDSSNENSSL